MIIYRPCRGLLEDSMKEVKEFNSEEELKEYIVNDNSGLLTIDDVVICDNIGNDDRIGWINVRHVCVKRYGDEDYTRLYDVPQCIGFCATDVLNVMIDN